MTRRTLSAIGLLATVCAAPSVCWGAPKNVILFIGDGMGPQAVDAARYYDSGGNTPLFFETLSQQARMTHYRAGGYQTDSAASATAMATGAKVDYKVVSVQTPGNGLDMATVLENFQSSGKKTALVTKGASITDATPAAFGAHTTVRTNHAEIANDYLTLKPNVLFGGSPSAVDSGIDLEGDAALAGYTVVTTETGFNALDPTSNAHFAGLFTVGQWEPALAAMTTKTLDILAHNNSNGFFAMIENSNTDIGGHDHNIATVTHAVIELNDAVQAAVTWATNAGVLQDTLIIVTADHETGGLTATNNGAGNLPGATWTAQHTQTPVPVYARGPNAGFVTGYIDNTDLHEIMITSAISPATATVTFQQGVDGYVGAHDTQVRAETADTAFGTTSLLVINTDDLNLAEDQSSQALIRFENLFGTDVGQVPLGATIISAALVITTGSTNGDQSSTHLSSVHQMLIDWNDNSTWNSLADGISTDGLEAAVLAESSLEPSALSMPLALDVTSSVQAWADGAPNYGWAVLATAANNWRWNASEAAIAGLRPMLSITYAVPEPSAVLAAQLSMVWLLLARRRDTA